jgi:hypothetical protein
MRETRSAARSGESVVGIEIEGFRRYGLRCRSLGARVRTDRRADETAGNVGLLSMLPSSSRCSHCQPEPASNANE